MNAVAVDDGSTESGREKASQRDGNEGVIVGEIWWICGQSSLEEKTNKNRPEEDSWRSCKQGQDDTEKDGDDQRWPAEILTLSLSAILERERLREIRIEANAEYSVRIGTWEKIMLPNQLENTTSALFVADEASVNGGPTDEGVAAVDGA